MYKRESGYESMDNYLYLDEHGQSCFIKPTNYEQKKTAKFRKQIGRIENVRYDEAEDCFFCAEGHKLPLRREKTELCHGQFALLCVADGLKITNRKLYSFYT